MRGNKTATFVGQVCNSSSKKKKASQSQQAKPLCTFKLQRKFITDPPLGCFCPRFTIGIGGTAQQASRFLPCKQSQAFLSKRSPRNRTGREPHHHHHHLNCSPYRSRSGPLLLNSRHLGLANHSKQTAWNTISFALTRVHMQLIPASVGYSLDPCDVRPSGGFRMGRVSGT